MTSINEQLTRADQFRRLGRLSEAEAICRQLLRETPGDPQAIYLLGVIALDAGQPGIALAFLRKARAARPDDPAIHEQVGAALFSRMAYQDSITSYEEALRLDPRRVRAWNGIASALLAQGLVEEAVAAYRRAVNFDPTKSVIYSNLLFSQQYSPTSTPAELLAEALRWGGQFDTPAGQAPRWCSRDRDLKRKLRIGYVSGDFWQHSVAYLLAPVLSAHDRDMFAVYCYTNAQRSDTMTDRLRSYSDGWRSILGLSDDEAAHIIQQDDIDLLVDLSGHTAGNRLSLFAKRPAPVQVTWLGYSGTTGLSAIDYLVGDRWVTPGGSETDFSESILKMPDAYLCYEPLETAPDVTPPPALTHRYVTFGCFNNLSKVTPDVVETWAEILKRLPSSRFLLKSHALDDEAVRQRYTALFVDHGVAPDALRLVGRTSQAELLRLYGEVDIALDPFPYNGTVTTLEALWMGVPLVSLVGDRFVARVGQSILNTIRLADLVVNSRQQYVERSLQLAQDPQRLSQLRAGLRSRMLTSPLLDATRFTRNLEAAYRGVWVRWCQTVPAS